MAALGTSLCWTITALAFEDAAKRIGSLALNVLRLFAALLIFMTVNLILHGQPIPLRADSSVWFWLSLSGLVGFVFGDIFLFQSYIDIGARTAQVIFVSSPLITALLGFYLLGERIRLRGILGMFMVVGAIIWVIAGKAATDRALSDTDVSSPSTSIQTVGKPLHKHRTRGILFAFFGALGQSGGLILSKIGAPHFDPLQATEIRVIAGLIGFIIMALAMGRFKEPLQGLANPKALRSLSIGAFFGPFLGVTLGLFAVQRAPAGIAATLMGLTPILIVFPSVVLYKEPLSIKEIMGACLAVLGLSLLFL